MKKRFLFIVLMLICITSVFVLTACNFGGNGGDGDKEPVNLTPYLGTDAELSAMTPLEDKYFIFTPIEGGEAYEIAFNYDEFWTLELDYDEVFDLVIPGQHDGKTVKQIAKDGFRKNNEYLRANVYIQPGVERICTNAFYNHKSDVSSKTRTFQIPSTLKVIELGAVNCTYFRAGTGIEVIESKNYLGFTRNNERQPVVLPPSLKRFDGNIFNYDADSMTSEKGITYIGNPNDSYMIAYSFNKNTPAIELNSSCKIIAPLLFKKHSSEFVALPEGIVSIGAEAFYESGLTMINIPNSVEYIGSLAFANCQKLTAVSLPDSLKTIYADAFKDSSKLKGNTEYGFCEYLGSDANPYFFLLRGVENLELDIQTATNGFLVHGNTKVIGYRAFYNAHLAWSGDNWESNEDYAHLLKLTIPDTVERIGECALFQRMGTIREISLPANFESLSDASTLVGLEYYFRYGVLSTDWPLTIAIRDGFGEIATNAFDDVTFIERLVLPASITTTYQFAFYAFKNIKHIILSEGITELKYSYFNNNALESFVLPKSVTTIEFSCFGSNNKSTFITYYAGTSDEFAAIDIDPQNNGRITEGIVLFYSETQQDGCWRYVLGVPTAW